MTRNPASSYERNQWQTSEKVGSWLAEQAGQAKRQFLREKLAALLPFDQENTIRVLDIGAGAGALGQAVFSAYPKAQVICHDFSEAMFEQARQQLAPFLKAVTFVESDLRDPLWTRAIDGNFDAVVSSFAIHNVAEQGMPERIREIYFEIFGLVKPGGCFLNLDNIRAAGEVLQRIYRKERLLAEQARLRVDMGIEKSLQELEQEIPERRRSRNGSSREQGESRLPRTRDLMQQLEWLKQAGFDEVDCLWRETPSFSDSPTAIIAGFRH